MERKKSFVGEKSCWFKLGWEMVPAGGGGVAEVDMSRCEVQMRGYKKEPELSNGKKKGRGGKLGISIYLLSIQVDLIRPFISSSIHPSACLFLYRKGKTFNTTRWRIQGTIYSNIPAIQPDSD